MDHINSRREYEDIRQTSGVETGWALANSPAIATTPPHGKRPCRGVKVRNAGGQERNCSAPGAKEKEDLREGDAATVATRGENAGRSREVAMVDTSKEEESLASRAH